MFRGVNIMVDAKFGCDESEASTAVPKELIASLVNLIGFHDGAGCNGDCDLFAAIKFVP